MLEIVILVTPSLSTSIRVTKANQKFVWQKIGRRRMITEIVIAYEFRQRETIHSLKTGRKDHLKQAYEQADLKAIKVSL